MRTYRQSYGDWRYAYLPLAWWLAAQLTRRRPVRLGDISFTLQCDNWITHFRWFLFGRKEPEILQFIDTFVKEDDIFFDVGTNIGIFTLYACKRHCSLKAYCFEPEYSNLHYLKENIIENGIADQVHVFSVALSDQTGFSSLMLNDLTPGAAMHREVNPVESGVAIWREGVFAHTLDEACRRLGVVPNALKIDTDGNEVKILAGAADTLKNHSLRSIAIEIPADPDASTCRRVLAEAGFKLAWSKPNVQNEIWSRE
jgi:FkbM family methyltransferase